MKKNIMLRIDAQVLETAKELGLNISKYCENALVNGINALSCADTETALRRVPGVPSASLVLRPGFEPGSPARKAGILDRTILPEPYYTKHHAKYIFVRINFILPKLYPSTVLTARRPFLPCLMLVRNRLFSRSLSLSSLFQAFLSMTQLCTCL